MQPQDDLSSARLRFLVPPGRRLLVVGEAADAGALGVAAEEGSLADIAVVTTAASLGEDPTAALAALRGRLDPAGLLVVGDAALERGTLEAVGFEAPSHPLAGTTVARPRWTADDVAAATRPPEAVTDVAVLVVGTPDDAALLALRLSLPCWIGLRKVEAVASSAQLTGAAASEPDDAFVLVLPATALPEPDWVQALWDGRAHHDRPVGVRTVGLDGRLLAAGMVDGRPFGAGARRASAPMYTADRPDAELHTPLLCRAADLRAGLPRGRLLGAAACPLRDVADGGGDTALVSVGEAWPRSVLVVGGASLESAEGAGPLAAALRLLATGGLTTVLSVLEPDRLHPSLLAAARDVGALTFRRPEVVGRSDRDAGLAQLAQLLQPEARVFLDRRRAEAEGGPAAVVNPSAVLVDADPSEGPGVLGADVRLPVTGVDFGARLLTALAHVAPPEPPRISTIAARPRRDGLTSIVIPVWNAWSLTEACLAALHAHTATPVQLIVVDNGSIDETPERLGERDDLVVVTNPTNRGFAAAVNQGLEVATGTHLCVLNNDTEVVAGWLEELHAALALPGTGMVGPRSNSISGLQLIPGAPLMAEARIRDWARDWATTRRGRSWRTSRLIGFCLLTTASLLERIGGFDEVFGIGNFEDDELCQRVRAEGLELRVADGSVVLHHGGATFLAAGIDYAGQLAVGARRFASRQHPIGGPVAAVVLSDAQPDDALSTAVGAAQVADRVVVLERSGLPDTELAVAAGMHQGTEVRGVDWHDDRALAPVLAGLDAELMFVVGAGEQVRCDEWGAARAELESAAGQPRRVRIGARAEIRAHAPVAAAGERIGADDEAVPVLQRTWLTPAP